MRLLFAVLACSLSLLAPALSQTEVPLAIGNKIQIAVGGVHAEEVAQMNGAYTIGDDGNISLLHLGAIKAAGMTASALAAKVMTQYREKEIYQNLNVVVNTDGIIENRLVYVDGNITRPGSVAFRPGLTTSMAIASAGGKTPYGSLKNVSLTRTSNGATQVTKLDLSKPGTPDGQLQVLPNDTLTVGK
jgi:protein involved in polysaccharide export with SLBB domain